MHGPCSWPQQQKVHDSIKISFPSLRFLLGPNPEVFTNLFSSLFLSGYRDKIILNELKEHDNQTDKKLKKIERLLEKLLGKSHAPSATEVKQIIT